MRVNATCGYGPVRMRRDDKWKYIWRAGNWPNKLFNMQADPEENNNLYDDPAYKDVVMALELKLKDWFKKIRDPRPRSIGAE